MKQITLLMLSIISINTIHTYLEYEFSIQPHWQDLEKDSKNSTLFGSKWIWAGTLTFKKRPQEQISLRSITLQWKGDTIKNLTGSLFRKEPRKPFLAVETNLVSDGVWDTKKQTLTFQFKKEEKLHPTDTFCLVLAIPDNLASTIRTGSFTIEQKTLPTAFQKLSIKKGPSLSCNQKIPKKTTTFKDLRT